MKGFFENFLALSVTNLKKVLMILPSISGRGRAFPAESCRSVCLVQRSVTSKEDGISLIIFRRTAPARICSLFLSFSKSRRRNNAKSAFNTLLTITPHNTQKRRRRKERTTYVPFRRYSRQVTHPVLNPDRQGLT